MSDLTKRALEESLKHLLLRKPVNKITINDLVEDCGVNRATFYYHFRDIYDLIEWSLEEDSRKALHGNIAYETWDVGFLNIFAALRENKPFIMNVYRHVNQEQIIQYLYRLIGSLLRDAVDACAEGMTVRDEDKRFIVEFYKFAFVGFVLEWVRQDMKPDPEQIVRQMKQMIGGDIQRMLNRARLDKPIRS